MLEFFVGLFEYGINLLLQMISASGYFGIFFLMALESAVIPIPSEIVMPFSGYLVWKGTFEFWPVVLAGTFGNLVGSILAYYVGLNLGRKFILKYGRYVLLKKKYLELTEKWFNKYGNKTIFFSRMLPAVRTVISLPAGIGKMNLVKFCLYTFVGSVPWNFALTYSGFWFGENWKLISNYTHILTALVIVGVMLLFSYWLIKIKRR